MARRRGSKSRSRRRSRGTVRRRGIAQYKCKTRRGKSRRGLSRYKSNRRLSSPGSRGIMAYRIRRRSNRRRR